MQQHPSTVKEADDCDGESVVATAKNSNEPTSSGSTAENSPRPVFLLLLHRDTFLRDFSNFLIRSSEAFFV
jgi:hypothetical protein